MTKSYKEKEKEAEAATAGMSTGDSLRTLAVHTGMEVVKNFLTAVVSAQSNDPFLKMAREQREMTAKQIGDEMSITLQTMVNTFIITLLRTVQKTDQLIAATGLLTSEGIPWDAENFEPEEVFAEADRLVRETEAQLREAQGKGSN